MSTNRRRSFRLRLWHAAGLMATAWPAVSQAQNSRLFDRPLPWQPVARQGVVSLGPPSPNYGYMVPRELGPTIEDAGWLAAPLPPPRELRKHDLITIRVDVASRTIQQGEVQRRKTSNFDALLRDWVRLEGLTALRGGATGANDPRVQAQLNNLYRANGDFLTTESMKFDIAAEVSDILPNGNIVVEANRKVRNNDEVWIVSLTGVISKDAIAPGNVVLSKDIHSLEITKDEQGIVRDAYQRGWVQKFWDRVKAF